MKKTSIIAFILAAVFTIPSFAQAAEAGISVQFIKETSIVPAKKIVSSGDITRVEYNGTDISKWKISFECPKGVSVFLDDQDLCKNVKNFGRSKDDGFALKLKIVNSNSSSKSVKLNAKAYGADGDIEKVKATINVRKK